MKVFVTKYVTTEGIKEYEVKEPNEQNPTMVETLDRWPNFFHGKDWHYDYLEAKKQAEIMVAKKINSLKKQIQNLEKMKFPATLSEYLNQNH